MKLLERGSCRWEPREGNFRTTATLVEGRVDRFSDGSSTLPASTSDSQGFGNRTLAVLFMDFSQCDCEAGAQKTTRYAGGDKELYKRNHLSDNIEVLKLLCQKGKVIPWLNRETV